MKFRNGFWLMKEGVVLLSHQEYVDCRRGRKDVRLYASGKRLSKRGDTLNTGLLTTILSSPHPDIIQVDVWHHMGGSRPGPRFLPDTVDCTPEFLDRGLSSGSLSSRLTEVGELEFRYGDRLLTSRRSGISGWMSTPEGTFMTEYLTATPGELFYGLGERFTPFVKNGQAVDIWNEDGGTCSEQAYKSIPFLLSSRGYGILVGSYGKVSFEVESEVVDTVQFSVPGEHLCYYVIGGTTLMDVFKNYTGLAGRPALPPRWSFGLWLSTSFTTDYQEETTCLFIDGMAEHDIPLSVFHFDCFWMKEYEWVNLEWNQDSFPDPEKMLGRLHARGLKVCVWINPYVGQKSSMFAEGVEHGYFIKRKNGDVWQWDLWQSGMAIVDFSNVEAKAWYCGKLKRLLDMGVDCFKTDFGERIPTDCVWFDGSDPALMHNYYAELYNGAIFDLLKACKGEDAAVVFARSATVGGQKYPVHWGGDCSASYSSMAETLRGGLSLALSGFSFWSHDIGGFEQTATADLFKRWIAFGLLSSHSRLHGSDSYRVPWNFDEESCRVLSFFTHLKLSLMPYLWRFAKEAHSCGIPLMRPMVLEFPEDRNARPLDMQYLLGPSLLVSPVMNGAGEGCCYLPAGRWTSLLDDEVVTGPRWYEKSYDYFSLPLFVRENSVIVRTDSIDPNETGVLTAHLYYATTAQADGIEISWSALGLEIVTSDRNIRKAVIHHARDIHGTHDLLNLDLSYGRNLFRGVSYEVPHDRVV